jgi:outer membrane protein assembly factor BamB
MRYAISAILGLLAGAACVFLFLSFGGAGNSAPGPSLAPRPRPTTASAPAPLPIKAGASWPMFRGGQPQQGRAQGALPDSLRLYWRFRTGDAVKSTPVVEGGLVCFGSSDGLVYAVDAASGQEKWRYKTEGGIEAAPLLLEGSLYVGSRDYNFYALDAGTGKLRWKFPTGAEILGAANWIRLGHRTCVLVGSYDRKLYCLDADEGKPVWSFSTENYVNGSAAVAAEKVVFGGCDKNVYILTAAEGTGPSVEAGGYIAASAAIDRDRAYVGDSTGQFLCIDLPARRVLWRYRQHPQGSSEGGADSGEVKDAFFSSAAIAADRILVGSNDGQLHCISRDGKPLWTFPTSSLVHGSPVVVGDKVVLGGEDGRLYLVRLSDGQEVWSYEIGSDVASSPAVAGGAVFVGCEDGYVYAFGPN